MAGTRRRSHRFIREHSSSIAAAGILTSWICLYSVSSPATHRGSFFGNAITDWSGVVVMVFATKYVYETGSAESRRPPKSFSSSVWKRLRDHSLSIFLVVTGIGWIRAVDETADRTPLEGKRSSSAQRRRGVKFFSETY
jgi:hypothetical protein